ncbi:MAG: hypothetical protein K0R59_4486 [Sphingobacterium sp.]|jgi:hypothetical protein|nr:hypothetical protein [Sphingobacterium sp.]
MAIHCEIYRYKANSFDKIFCSVLVLSLLWPEKGLKKTCMDSKVIVYKIHNDLAIATNL